MQRQPGRIAETLAELLANTAKQSNPATLRGPRERPAAAWRAATALALVTRSPARLSARVARGAQACVRATPARPRARRGAHASARAPVRRAAVHRSRALAIRRPFSYRARCGAASERPPARVAFVAYQIERISDPSIAYVKSNAELPTWRRRYYAHQT